MTAPEVVDDLETLDIAALILQEMHGMTPVDASNILLGKRKNVDVWQYGAARSSLRTARRIVTYFRDLHQNGKDLAEFFGRKIGA